MEKKKEKKVRYIILALILLIFVLIVLFLLNGSETYTSEEAEKDEVVALYCKAGQIEEAFFTSSTANTTNHEIKITIKNGKLDKMNYIYKGVYRSDEVASADETHLHAKYNIYMGENDIEQESLSPDYSVANSKFQLSLYVDDYNNKINNVTAKLFFIKKDDVEKFSEYPINTLKSYYEEEGFQCNIVQ